MTLQNNTPLPAALSRRDDPTDREWEIVEGSINRGGPFTDFDGSRMRVPLDDGATARVVRAHEMMHAKVSPSLASDQIDEIRATYGKRVVECAEELRVNTLIARAGFDLDALVDGSERKSGIDQATTGTRAALNESVCFAAATLGGKAGKDFVAGVAKVKPEWAKLLRAMTRTVAKEVKGWSTGEMASTSPYSHDDPAGAGFLTFHYRIDRIINGYLDNPVADGGVFDSEMARRARRAGEVGGRRAPTGRWADLIPITLDFDVEGAGSLAVGRRRRAANVGRRVAYPSNLLRDPHRRIMAATSKGAGGVVLIDQSGSMDVALGDLTRLLEIAPSLTVVGYSHEPGSSDVANVWIMARNGRRTSTVYPGGVGNGVDGPALTFAHRLRRAGEPLLWVFDGQSTDSNDHPYGAGECAALIRRYRVHCVSDLVAAEVALRRGRAFCSTTVGPKGGRVGEAFNSVKRGR